MTCPRRGARADPRRATALVVTPVTPPRPGGRPPIVTWVDRAHRGLRRLLERRA